jgi:hypothetical protein
MNARLRRSSFTHQTVGRAARVDVSLEDPESRAEPAAHEMRVASSAGESMGGGGGGVVADDRYPAFATGTTLPADFGLAERSPSRSLRTASSGIAT